MSIFIDDDATYAGPFIAAVPPWQQTLDDSVELTPLVEPNPAVLLDVAVREVARLRAERDEARAERDDLRAALAASRRLRAGVPT